MWIRGLQIEKTIEIDKNNRILKDLKKLRTNLLKTILIVNREIYGHVHGKNKSKSFVRVYTHISLLKLEIDDLLTLVF